MKLDPKILAGICWDLGSNWSVVATERDSWWDYLRNTDGPQLSIEFSEKEKKIHVSPSWPRHPTNHKQYIPYQPETQSIYISASKPTLVIAKEIHRRLLNTFVIEWHQQQQRMRNEMEHRAWVKEQLERLGSLPGCHFPRQHDYDTGTVYAKEGCELRINSKNSAELKLNGSFMELAALFEAWVEQRQLRKEAADATDEA